METEYVGTIIFPSYCAFGENTFFHVLIHKMENIKTSHVVVK